jgi:hypothetical protein
MNIRRKRTDQAVVGVVTAILLTGVIVAVLALVQTVYVPKIMEQREAEHMDKVAEQFSYIASVIDGQAADKTTGIPIATSLTLGSKELPYLLSVRSYGSLELFSDTCSISLSNTTESGLELTSSIPIGTIEYSSANAYFLDQSYAYEAGAMIVSQSQGSLMMIRPGFFVEYSENETVNISFDVVSISSIGQKTIAAGYGIYPIQTEYKATSEPLNFTKVQTLTLNTSYPNAWEIYLNRTLSHTGLNAQGYGSNYRFSETVQSLTIDFSTVSSPRNVSVVFRIIDIAAQIGPGWVE